MRPPPPKPQPQPPRPAPANPAPPGAAAPAQAAPGAAPARPAVSATAGLEAAFVGRLRAYIETIKRYPTSKEAKLLRPSGTVEVGFVLNRAGEVSAVAVQKSSGSSVLDQQAMSTVRGGTYPRMPDEAWSGEASHRFFVQIELSPQ
jgi:protein TonB